MAITLTLPLYISLCARIGAGRGAARSHAITQAGDALHLGAMLATEIGAVLLEAMTDDTDPTVLAVRRQRMDRAFEAVEGVGRAVHADLEALVVVVSARFASGHDDLACDFWGLTSTTPT